MEEHENRLLASSLSLVLALSLTPAIALAEEPLDEASAAHAPDANCGDVSAATGQKPSDTIAPDDSSTPSNTPAADMPFEIASDQPEGSTGYEIGNEVVNNISVNILKITTGGCYAIKQTDPNTLNNWRIEVTANSGTVEVVLSGLNIDLTGTGSSASKIVGCRPLSITGACDTTVTLADGSTNSLLSGPFRAGIENNTHPIAIQCETAKANGHHNCEENGACGSLATESPYGGAGIGGYGTDNLDTGVGANIEVLGGLVTATGGQLATGIGGSYGPGYNLTFSGRIVKARHAKNDICAAIGGGSTWSERPGFDGYDIKITGGTVDALSDGCWAAAIGGGWKGNGRNITITSGSVTAVSTASGAGIGGGGGQGENIVVSGGTVSASSTGGAGIGGEQLGTGCNIAITGGTVSAASNGNGAGIGGGGWKGAIAGNAENIQVSAPAEVTADSAEGVEIGGGSPSDPAAPGGNADNILITTPVKTTGGTSLVVGAGISKEGDLKGEDADIAYVDKDAVVHITSDGEKITARPTRPGEQIAVGQDHQITILEGRNLRRQHHRPGKRQHRYSSWR